MELDYKAIGKRIKSLVSRKILPKKPLLTKSVSLRNTSAILKLEMLRSV